jgi:hypothetical protein
LEQPGSLLFTVLYNCLVGNSMKHSVENTVRLLAELSAPELLIRLAKGIRAPGVLEFEFQPPYVFYELIGDDAEFPFHDSIVPLWETNGDSVTGFIRLEQPFVIRYYYEDQPSEYKVIGRSIMEAIEQKLAWLLGECGNPPEEVLAAVKACDHPNPEEFVRRRDQKV